MKLPYSGPGLVDLALAIVLGHFDLAQSVRLSRCPLLRLSREYGWTTKCVGHSLSLPHRVRMTARSSRDVSISIRSSWLADASRANMCVNVSQRYMIFIILSERFHRIGLIF